MKKKITLNLLNKILNYCLNCTKFNFKSYNEGRNIFIKYLFDN